MHPFALVFAALTLASLIAPHTLLAQNPKEMAVMLSATVIDQPAPRITLQWNREGFQEKVFVWRKAKEDASFPVAALDSVIGTGTQWTDSKALRGVAYEYRVFRYSKAQVGYDSAAKQPIYRWFYGTGYIVSGIAAPPAPRERMLVLVDSTMLNPLKSGLTLLQQDLENEGWEVTVLGVPRAEAFTSAKVTAVRDLIKREWNDGQKDLGGVFLLGRVPVPYGGNIAPDGHPDHIGAWPADGVYGDIDGVYNDNFTNVANASRPVNANVVGDGKFDPSQWVTDVDIPVGRVDFFDMPVFAKSETELLQAYLQKDHAYRTDQWSVKMGGVIDDNFGTYGELFASSAWRSFSVFGADTAVKAGDFFNDLAGPTTMLLGYGCGGGTDVSAGGIGTSTDLATKPVNAVFTMLFGSYFGDWNTKNNFMRASLGTQPRVLTCGWSGRPHWYIHHMALGETIGYSTRISQNNRPIVGNNFGNYTPNIVVMPNGLSVSTTGDRNLHIALMGDPSLRVVTKPVAAIGTVTGQTVYPHKVQLSWTKPTGDVQAYLVYRKLAGARRWTPLTKYPITETTFTDSIVNEGSIQYMVRCCALRKTASGTFYDMGKGRIATVITTGVEEDVVTTGMHAPSITVWPNPATTDVNVTLTLTSQANVALELADVTGNVVWKFDAMTLAPGQHHVSINVAALVVGRYMLRTSSDGSSTTSLITITR